VLERLLGGESVYAIVDAQRDREAAARDIHHFFVDLRALMNGCWTEHEERRAVEKVPFTLPFNTLPVLSEIALTYRCNLACRFCYASCGCRKDEAAAELGTGEFERILGIIRHEAEVRSVSFTGGEPTLRADLEELVAHAKSLGFWVNLITNGTLLSTERVAALKTAGLDSAQVSIEAGEAALHDRIVAHDGAFDRSLAGIRALLAAGIRVHTNTTISALNRDHLEGILDGVESLGLKTFSMNLLMPAGRSLGDLDGLIVTYREIGAIVRRVAEASTRRGLEFLWYSPTPVCLFNPIAHGLGNKGCAACDGLLSISPRGEILPCSSYVKPMANLIEIEGRFKETWRNPAFAWFQEKRFAPEACRGCDRLAVCQGGCPLYWDAVGCGELDRTKADIGESSPIAPMDVGAQHAAPPRHDATTMTSGAGPASAVQ
jgi:radical SAM protein with 4Fe4S-binding SPASM domain